MKRVPESITVNTGEQHRVQKTIDDFFADVIRVSTSTPNEFRIESGEIAFLGNVSDNRVTYLLYKERVVACVLETRTEYNYVHYDFFRNLKNLKDA